MIKLRRSFFSSPALPYCYGGPLPLPLSLLHISQAMCFSLVACAGVPVIINDPECTAKTFPTYFDVLAGLASSA